MVSLSHSIKSNQTTMESMMIWMHINLLEAAVGCVVPRKVVCEHDELLLGEQPPATSMTK